MRFCLTKRMVVALLATLAFAGASLVPRSSSFAAAPASVAVTSNAAQLATNPPVGTYDMVASDGGIFTFGDAGFYGSMGATPLNAPVVGMAADPSTGGYWLVASDGGIFSFNAPFLGSMGATPLNAPVVGMATVPYLDPYASGQYGTDVSFPQCTYDKATSSYSASSDLVASPANTGIAVLGVTYENILLPSGTSSFPSFSASFGENPCLKAEYLQALSSGAQTSLYATLWAPPISDPMLFSGPEAVCAGAGPSSAATICQAYDWGYNLVAQAVAYAASQGVTSQLWWLDVESPNTSSFTYTLWSINTSVNAAVVAGATDKLRTLGYQGGIYSTYYQYPLIAGATSSPGLPIWIAGATSASQAAAFCVDPAQSFGGGTPWLVQGPYVNANAVGGGATNVDSDYAC